MKFKKLITLGLICTTVATASISVLANEVETDASTETSITQRGFGRASGNMQRGLRGGINLSEEQSAELYDQHAEIYAEVAGITVDEAKALADDVYDFRVLANENGLTEEFYEAMSEYMEELGYAGGFKGGMLQEERGVRGGLSLTEEEQAELYDQQAEIYAEVAGITVDEAKALADEIYDFRILADENDLSEEFMDAMRESMDGIGFQRGSRGRMQGGSRGGRGCRGIQN